ncbi:MAG: HD-GYP domain-containing protein [Peptococcaceae bacterium]|nr:HD-GYP domain-containing protein [Peptococcaceae bacterium]
MDISLIPVQVDALDVGVLTSYDLFDEVGKLLLAKDELVTESVYELLQRRQVYRIAQGHVEAVPVKRFSAHVYREVLTKVQHLYYEAALVDSEQLSQTIELVEVMVKELETCPKQFVDLNALRTYDNDLYVHSVNVAILSGMIGAEHGYSGRELRGLVLGALLHDIGKLGIPKEILNKPSGLTNDEFALMKEHPEKGVALLANVTVSASVLNIIRHHHERWDGSGYPYGLIGPKNSLNSQIVAVADVFDAITADRPYRSGLPFYHSYELVVTNQGLNPDVLQVFKRCIVFYPENSFVTLNTGEVGQVIEVPLHYPTRPTVRVLFDSAGNPVFQQTISLLDDLTRFISKVSFDGGDEKYHTSPVIWHIDSKAGLS